MLTPDQLQQKLADLATRTAILDFRKLRDDRFKKGFEHFIMDLLNHPYKNDGHGWTFGDRDEKRKFTKADPSKKGVLNVKPDHDSAGLNAWLHAMLRKYPWFETQEELNERLAAGEVLPEPQLPPGFDKYTELFKSLGKFGPNLAIDVPMLFKELDGSLSSMFIKRFDGTWAFIGGMCTEYGLTLKSSEAELLALTRVKPDKIYCAITPQGIVYRTDKTDEKVKGADGKVVKTAEGLDQVIPKTAVIRTDELALLVQPAQRVQMMQALQSKNAEQLKQFLPQILSITTQRKHTVDSEQAPLAQAIEEVLEELYSNNMFAKGSMTAAQANLLPADQLAKNLDTVLDMGEFGKLKPIRDKLTAAFGQPGDVAGKVAALKAAVLKEGAILKDAFGDPIRLEDLGHFMVRIKTQLYKMVFPEQFKNFDTFLRQFLLKCARTINETDPRNTQLAWMETIPFLLYMMREEFQKVQQSFLLAEAGGDDATEARTMKIQDFFDGDLPVFSAHRRIMLGMMQQAVQIDPGLAQSPAFQAQVEEIEQKTQAREAKELGVNAVQVAGSQAPVVLQQTELPSGVRAAVIPQVSTKRELDLLNQTKADMAGKLGQQHTEMRMNEEVADTLDYLERLLGEDRMRRIHNRLEDLRIPASYVSVLEDVNQKDLIEILVDNSGSMAGQNWADAKERFQKLMPLLALAGCKVRVRFINEPSNLGELETLKTVHTGQRKTARPQSGGYQPMTPRGVFEYDFTLFKDGANHTRPDDIMMLEQEEGRMAEFLTAVFDRGVPSGGTVVNSHFENMIGSILPEKKVGIMFLTDGEASDKTKIEATVKKRQNKQNSQIIVVACTKKSDEINWVRELQKDPNNYIYMLDDYAIQQAKLQNVHGSLVNMTKEIWVAMHLAFPRDPSLPNNQSGFHLYIRADKLHEELTPDELKQFYGYKPDDATYRAYQAERLRALATIQATGSYAPPPPAYASLPGSQQPVPMQTSGLPTYTGPAPMAVVATQPLAAATSYIPLAMRQQQTAAQQNPVLLKIDSVERMLAQLGSAGSSDPEIQQFAAQIAQIRQLSAAVLTSVEQMVMQDLQQIEQRLQQMQAQAASVGSNPYSTFGQSGSRTQPQGAYGYSSGFNPYP